MPSPALRHDFIDVGRPPSPGDNTRLPASEYNLNAVRTDAAYDAAMAVSAVVDALRAGAPGALDTFKELADALEDDPNFSTTILTALAGKADKDARVISVRDFGAVGNGVADDSAAFVEAQTYVKDHVGGDSYPSPRSTVLIDVPPGTYLIRDPGALMKDLGLAAVTRGFRYRGPGRDVGMIVFSPEDDDEYLMDNEDAWGFCTFSDLSFHSTVPGSSFMKSYSAGNGLGYQIFDRINWSGDWKYGIDLSGTDNNDHMTWRDCSILGNWTSFLHSDLATSTDQNLEYHFSGTHVEQTTGDFVDLPRGGNVKVFGGSYIHLGDGDQSTSSEQTFFKLGVGETTHAAGVCSLLVEGIRVEHRHNNSKLIRCDWQGGSVKFDTCDTDSFAPLLFTPGALVQAEFGAAAVSPSVVFDNCRLMGKHEYHYNSPTASYQQSASYRDCQIANFAEAKDFITLTNDAVGIDIVGSRPLIKFDQCRGSGFGSRTVIFDTWLNWQFAVNGALPIKRAHMCKAGPPGGLPFPGDGEGTADLTLPPDSFITGVRAFKPAGGADTSTTFTYTLTDADAQVVAQAVGDGIATWADGFTYDSGPIAFPMSTTNKRTLTLTPANIEESTADTFFLVEYIG